MQFKKLASLQTNSFFIFFSYNLTGCFVLNGRLSDEGVLG